MTFFTIGYKFPRVKMIGARIKTAREMQGFSLSELARRVGVRPASCSHWESCRSDPSMDNLARLAVILNVDFEWLATGRGGMRPGVAQDLPSYAVDAAPPDQRELLDLYLRLKPQRQRALLELLRAWR